LKAQEYQIVQLRQALSNSHQMYRGLQKYVKLMQARGKLPSNRTD